MPEGRLTSFPLAVRRKADETALFSWITWPSRSARDAGMKNAMEDPRLENLSMPFDGKRMIYRGFEVMLDA